MQRMDFDNLTEVRADNVFPTIEGKAKEVHKLRKEKSDTFYLSLDDLRQRADGKLFFPSNSTAYSSPANAINAVPAQIFCSRASGSTRFYGLNLSLCESASPLIKRADKSTSNRGFLVLSVDVVEGSSGSNS